MEKLASVWQNVIEDMPEVQKPTWEEIASGNDKKTDSGNFAILRMQHVDGVLDGRAWPMIKALLNIESVQTPKGNIAVKI